MTNCSERVGNESTNKSFASNGVSRAEQKKHFDDISQLSHKSKASLSKEQIQHMRNL